jgi:pyruvate,water dikinase
MSSDLTWEAPGEGDWWLVREHMPYATSRMFSTLLPGATVGWKTGGARYGLPIGEPRWGTVNSWTYFGPEVPLTAAELGARETTARATFSSTPWRDEVQRWHDEERPQAVAANLALQREDLGALDDATLDDHFRRAVANSLRWSPLHFEHVGFDIVAGLLIEAAGAAGVSPVAVLGLLTGASTASSAVDTALRSVADALDKVAAPSPVTSLDDIRAAGPDAAAALDAHLDLYGWRPIAGHDLLEPTFGERPWLVVAAVNACRARPRATTPDLGPAVDEVRRRIPEDDRARFDALLADARAAYALRDDDVGVCWAWPLGLVRRAALEIGRRLSERGRLADPRHILEADPDEASALLTGAAAPSADDLSARWTAREHAASAEPPRHLAGGGAPAPPPSVPPTVARLNDLRNAVWSVKPTLGDTALSGVGIGTEDAVGPARIVRQAEDIALLVEGDILVAIATTTAFNAVFPLLSGVVTEQGGILSHAAILARELGLPAVVGVADIFTHITDGTLLRLTPTTGTVHILDHT